MKQKNIYLVKWLIPICLLILTEWLKFHPEWIETYYSNGIYPAIGLVLRWSLGNIPFSIGDTLIGMTILYVLVKLILTIRNLISGNLKRSHFFKNALGKWTRILLWVYFLFHAFWGFNYYRSGSAYLLQLPVSTYTTSDVDSLVFHLKEKLVQVSADSSGIENRRTNNRLTLSKEAVDAYDLASRNYAFLKFRKTSLKPNLLGKLQSYTGYAGYLFPFTGEAHADFNAPEFSLPFTVCHEMAHQLGFGTESEANLIGFLSGRASSNPAFVYSTYASMFQYGARELYNRDTTRLKNYVTNLPGLYKKDREEMFTFSTSHDSFMQPVLNGVYNMYLMGNNQPAGLDSYNEVVAWLIAFGKKYGWNNL